MLITFLGSTVTASSSSLTLSAHAREGYSSHFVSLSVKVGSQYMLRWHNSVQSGTSRYAGKRSIRK